MADFFTVRQQKASKPYECDACGKKITTGTKYEYRFWKDGGNTFYSRFHLECAQAVDDYCRENDYDEYELDTMKQEFIEGKCCVCKKNTGRCKPNRRCWCSRFEEGRYDGYHR